ncbi:hypothetical protein GGI25_005744 [Coemansia spiralis]|uniref:TPR-like protein n=2 Tax=Coemansia TaxID=4863 RepID=A0A9W8G233_9FUNG|nr:hypothetical protein BX070DRAFT_219192 [Coemansia spiralis]KAJ1987524.1 hypothetical protein EDC05_005796 [Coemansia umbellata]KAJ2619332.1 hypothetical protein GGI26_005908 [Coemansia sp. RSA 1358]KAJ2670722.1 hypothetical protein GGI25_005744 [Coemansia spiralis]
MAQTKAQLSQIEIQVILGQLLNSASQPNISNSALAESLINGEYETVLKSDTAKAIFGTDLDSPSADAVCANSSVSPFDIDFSANDIKPYINVLVSKYVQENGDQAWKHVTWIGVACLYAFIQTNWTGPELMLDPAALLPKPLAAKFSENYIAAAGPIDSSESPSKHEIGRRQQIGRVYLGAKQSNARSELDRAVLRLLEYDGEEAYSLTPRPLYLYLARLLLIDIPASNDQMASKRDEIIPSAHWLAGRLLLIQQTMLDYPSQTLLDELLNEYKKVSFYLPESPASQQTLKGNTISDDSTQAVPAIDAEMPSLSCNMEDEPVNDTDASKEAAWQELSPSVRNLWTRYLIEVGMVYSRHYMPFDSKNYFSHAQAASGLQWEMTGAKGKRTKFQQFDITQLVLLAKSSLRANIQDSAVPENFDLNDDTLLERIKFTNPSAEIKEQGQLQIIDQCILLAFCLNVRNENPAHGLTSEQMMPFVTRVLEQPSNWSVYTMGLLLRSQLEAEHTRTAQRAVLQLQELVDQISHPLPGTQEAGVAERLSYFSALSLPSQWELERQLADRFMSLGIVRSSLDIYERLELWDEVVSCYVTLGQSEVAERIIRKQLEEQPDRPKLWCVLGNLKNDPEHWRHAWEISGQRFARAMRSLGSYHYKKGEYKEAIECYQNALNLNPLFESSWYMLGCAAMTVKEWDIAAPAFRRVISIENDNGEAYNNLASVYLKMGEQYKERAWHVLREAVKHKRDSWQVWDNFMTISLNLGRISSAIHAMERIIELRSDSVGADAVDLPSLRRIINFIVRGQIADGPSAKDAAHKQEEYDRYMKHLLVNTIETRITNSAQLWRAMADYWFWTKDYRHCLDCYIKAYRCLSQRPEITYALPVFNDAAEAALELVSMYENVGDKVQQVLRVPTTSDEHTDQELPGRESDNSGVGADSERKIAAVAEPVCADWRHQAKMVLRGLVGKGKESFEGTPNYIRLAEALKELRQA